MKHNMDLDDDDIVLTSAHHHRARRIISDVLDVETDATANTSRAKDRRLMDDITSRLYKVDCENVKIGHDISSLTVPRRFGHRPRSRSRSPRGSHTAEYDDVEETTSFLADRYDADRGRKRGRPFKRSNTVPSPLAADGEEPLGNDWSFKRRAVADDALPLLRPLPRASELANHDEAKWGGLKKWDDGEKSVLGGVGAGWLAAAAGGGSGQAAGLMATRKKIMDDFGRAASAKLAADDPLWERRVEGTLSRIRRSLRATDDVDEGGLPYAVPLATAGHSLLATAALRRDSPSSLHHKSFVDLRSELQTEPSSYASARRAASEAPGASSSSPSGALNPSADLAIREAKRYLARLENELGAPDDGYSSPVYGRSNIVTKRERGVPVVYLGDDDMYIPVVKAGSSRPAGLYSYGSLPRLSRVSSRYDYGTGATSDIYGGGVGGGNWLQESAYTSYDRANALPTSAARKSRHAHADDYELDDYFDEIPKRSYSSINGLAKQFSAAAHSTPSTSDVKREKPTYNFKPSDYAAYRAPFRPTMSDTRRQIRDLICRTRKDPHYYDD